jgi:hypothetical protein
VADKSAMKKHLHDLKKTCPGVVNTIILTDEIKSHILANRVYTRVHLKWKLSLEGFQCQ